MLTKLFQPDKIRVMRIAVRANEIGLIGVVGDVWTERHLHQLQSITDELPPSPMRFVMVIESDTIRLVDLKTRLQAKIVNEMKRLHLWFKSENKVKVTGYSRHK